MHRSTSRFAAWRRSLRRKACAFATAGLTALFLPSQGYAQLFVSGSPGYDSAAGTGFREGDVLTRGAVNNGGAAVGESLRYESNGWLGFRAVRWDYAGAAGELAPTDSAVGFGFSMAYAINDAGVAVGETDRTEANVPFMGLHAVRWDSAGTPTFLASLGANSNGSGSRAFAINQTGVATGYSEKQVAGASLGQRAVRWDSAGGVTELGVIDVRPSGFSSAVADDLNDAGTVVGSAERYLTGLQSLGYRAVRWNAGGTAATELGHLGTSNDGFTNSTARAVNESGTAAGIADKYVAGVERGRRAVRWDSASTAAVELDHLGTIPGGYTIADAYDINDAGTVVGSAEKYVAGVSKGNRAVRWDAGGTAATELPSLSVNADGTAGGIARAVNAAGAVVGASSRNFGSVDKSRATFWLPNTTAVDLNDLGVVTLHDAGSWQLEEANALSSDGWIAGAGTFTPTVGESYRRLWVAQVGFGGAWTDAFTGDLNGTWGRGKQWSTGTPAMLVGDAAFNRPETYSVGLDRHEQTKSVSITAGSVTLNLNGFTLEALNGMSVSGDAALTTAGKIVGDVTFGDASTLAPGASVATLEIAGALNLGSGAQLDFQLLGPEAMAGVGSSDLVNVENLLLDGTLHAAVAPGSSFASAAPGTRWRLFNYSGLLTDNGLTLGQMPELADPAWRYAVDASIAGRIDLVVYTIPEPASGALLLAAVASAISRRTRHPIA